MWGFFDLGFVVAHVFFPLEGSVELTCGFYTLTHLQRALHVVHALGVNFRFLLKVRSRSQNQITRNLLLCECVSRQIKKSFRRLLREALVASNGFHDVQVAIFLSFCSLTFLQASKVIVDRSNVIFSESKTHLVNETATAWNEIAEEMQSYFGPLGDTAWSGKQLRERILSFPLGMILVFLRINEQLGMEVTRFPCFFFCGKVSYALVKWGDRVQLLVDSTYSFFESLESEKSCQGKRLASIAGFAIFVCSMVFSSCCSKERFESLDVHSLRAFVESL